jgi:hypothetical protein
MKFGGKKLTTRNYVFVTLRKGAVGTDEAEEYTFKVAAAPAGWSTRYRKTGLLDYPDPPFKKVKIAGVDFRRKPGQAANADLVPDKNDPTYLQKLYEVNRRVTALRLREALKEDENVEFEAKEPDEDASPEAWAEYADALADSIEEALTSEEVDAILKASEDAGVVYEIEKAVESF